MKRLVAEKAVSLLKAPQVKGGEYTVVLDPILAGVFIREGWEHPTHGAVEGGVAQAIVQTKAVVFTIVWSAIAAVIALTVAKFTVGLRVTDNEEDNGLDQGSHGESAYS